MKYRKKPVEIIAHRIGDDGWPRDEMRLARLVAVVAGEGMLSEGQLAKILELDRVAVRRLEDEGLTCLSYRPIPGDWGANQMRRLTKARGTDS